MFTYLTEIKKFTKQRAIFSLSLPSEDKTSSLFTYMGILNSQGFLFGTGIIILLLLKSIHIYTYVCVCKHIFINPFNFFSFKISKMASDYEDYCDIWAENAKNIEDELRTSVTFSLLFHVSFIHIPQDSMEDDEVSEINNLTESAVEDKAIEVARDRLINNVTCQETLEGILSSIHVPSRPLFVEKILSCARSMASDKTYEGYKVLRMHVRMCVVVDDNDDIEELQEISESTLVAEGASKEAIERLETVQIDEDQLRRQQCLCAICLQEFVRGLHVTCLPCFHFFHGDCILNWLNKSKVCPLCRSEI